MTDVNDPAGSEPQELSSEALLRQAREQLAMPPVQPGTELPVPPMPSAEVPLPAPPSPSPGPEWTAPPEQASLPTTPPIPPVSGGAPPPAPWQAQPPSPGPTYQPASTAPVSPPPSTPRQQPPPPSPARQAPPYLSTPLPPKKKSKKLWWIMGVIGALVSLGAVVSAGSTTARSLQVGDCYESPADGEEFLSLDDQDCAGPHEMQIYSKLDADSYNSAEAIEECDSFITSMILIDGLLDSDLVTLPDDTGISFLEILDGGGDVETYFCVIESPSGQLVGSILDV